MTLKTPKTPRCNSLLDWTQFAASCGKMCKLIKPCSFTFLLLRRDENDIKYFTFCLQNFLNLDLPALLSVDVMLSQNCAGVQNPLTRWAVFPWLIERLENLGRDVHQNAKSKDCQSSRTDHDNFSRDLFPEKHTHNMKGWHTKRLLIFLSVCGVHVSSLYALQEVIM